MAERYRQVEKFGVELNKTNDVSFNEKKTTQTHAHNNKRKIEGEQHGTHTHSHINNKKIS